MQILLKQPDIEQAIRDYIKNSGITRPVTSIDFTATRGPAGIQAEIQLNSLSAVAVNTVPAAAAATDTASNSEPADQTENLFDPKPTSEDEGSDEAAQDGDEEPGNVSTKKLFA